VPRFCQLFLQICQWLSVQTWR